MLRREGQLSRLSLCRGVFLVCDLLAPNDGAARVVHFLHGDVGHEAVGRSAVPVVLARLEVDAVAGTNDLDLSGAALASTDALGHIDRLPEGMGVPCGPRTRGEVHAGRGES